MRQFVFLVVYTCRAKFPAEWLRILHPSRGMGGHASADLLLQRSLSQQVEDTTRLSSSTTSPGNVGTCAKRRIFVCCISSSPRRQRRNDKLLLGGGRFGRAWSARRFLQTILVDFCHLPAVLRSCLARHWRVSGARKVLSLIHI